MTTGETGAREEARGLAQELSADAEERLISVNPLWALAPPRLIPLAPPAVVAVGGPLAPPWPDVLVTCGRRSGRVSMAIKRANPAPMVTVHVQAPHHAKLFDLVVAMTHHGVQGDNVMHVDTALHSVRPAALEAAASQGDPRFNGMPRPWTGVMMGSSTQRHPFGSDDAVRLAEQLDVLRKEIGGSLLITPSPRTPASALAVLSTRYGADRTVRIWNGAPPNPYLTVLGLADRLVVTSDSASMISEALATTAPVLVFHLTGGRRHAHFVENLIAKGLVGELHEPSPPDRRVAHDATLHVTAAVRRLIAEKLHGANLAAMPA